MSGKRTRASAFGTPGRISEDLALDPFFGSGSTGLAALKSHRHYVGYDIESEYVALAKKRLAAYKSR